MMTLAPNNSLGKRMSGWRAGAWLAAAFGMLSPSSAAALDVRGVSLPERVAIAPTVDLVLNGAGVRTQASLDRYVAALYLPARSATLREILADPGPKRLRLTLLRDMRAAYLTESLMEAIAENYTASELESLKAPLDELVALIDQPGAGRVGTSIVLDYVPGAGTSVSINGGRPAKPIRGADLYPAVLRAWLGEDPIDRALRRALLGR